MSISPQIPFPFQIKTDKENLDPIPKITREKVIWSQVYDENLEYRIEPSGEIIAEKLQKALDRAYTQQSFEFEDDLLEEKELSLLPLVHTRCTSIDDLHIVSTQGKRDEQEDTAVADCFELHKTRFEVSAVFDGHESDAASKYSQKEVVGLLKRNLELFNPHKLTDAGIWNALKMTCVQLDRAYSGPRGGTCANIVLKTADAVWCANVGDSRAFIVDEADESYYQLSHDQRPEDPYYEKGIKKRNGFIRDKRVNGLYAMARRIGSHEWIGGNACMSARPKVTKFPLTPGHSYLLLQVSDGLYEGMTTKTASKYLQKQLALQNNLEFATKKLVRYSVDTFESTDNVTVIARRIYTS